MPTVEIELKGLDEVLDNLTELAERIERGKSVPMQLSLDTVEQAVVTRTPVNVGTLRSSIQTMMRGQGVDLTGVVYSPLAYAPSVERGRKPGKMPPVEAIRYWVIRKGIADGPEADQAAFLIARAIGRRGTKGVRMFEQGWQEAAPHIPGIWLRWLRDQLQRAR